MSVTTTLAACSQTVSSNGPDGAVDPPSTLDDAIRYALSFIAYLRDTKSDSTTIYSENVLVNGDMRVAQRTPSGALTTTISYVSLDRWAVNQATSAAGGFAQVAYNGSGFTHVAKLGRNNGVTNAGVITMAQAMETLNSVQLQGQTVIVSFYAYAGNNFSAASSTITAKINTGTGTDQSTASMVAGTWTGAASTSNSPTITTTLTRYSFTAAIPALATQVGLQISYTPVGTAGADDYLYITGVKIEIAASTSTTPTAYVPGDYALQFAKCQRWLTLLGKVTAVGTNYFANGFTNSTSTALIAGQLPVQMRSVPTVSMVGTTGLSLTTGAASSVVTAVASSSSTNLSSFALTVTGTGTPYTSNQPALLYNNATTPNYIQLTSEL